MPDSDHDSIELNMNDRHSVGQQYRTAGRNAEETKSVEPQPSENPFKQK